MPEEQMVGAEMTSYTPDEIQRVTEVLAPQAGNYVNAITDQIGQAQESIGPLAANTMGSTTAGLGNYTYNRLARPQIDVMRDEILVKGYTDKLNKLLSDNLRAAQQNYAKSSGGTTKSSNTENQKTTTEEKSDENSWGFWGDSSTGTKSVNIGDKIAHFGLYELRRPDGLTDQQWYDYATKWAATMGYNTALDARKNNGGSK